MRYVSFFAGVILGVLIAPGAYAQHLEISTGITKFHAREDGIWWQSNEQLQTRNDFKSQGYQIGARWDLARHVAARLAWVNLGHFYADNEFVGDDSVDHYPFQCAINPWDCKLRGKISGTAYGVTLGPVLRGDWRGWTGEIEGGAFVFRSTQNTVVCPEEAGSPYESCFSYNRMWGVHRTWYMGAGIGRGRWMINYRLYHNVYEQGNTMPGGDVGITGGPTQTVFLTYQF